MHNIDKNVSSSYYSFRHYSSIILSTTVRKKNQESCWTNGKALLDEVFVISRIIKVEVGVISQSQRLRLITLMRP